MATTPINSIHRSSGNLAAQEARRKLLEEQQGEGLQNLQAKPTAAPQLNLFDKTTYGIKTSDASQKADTNALGLPSFSDDEKEQISSLIDSVPDEHKAEVNQAGVHLAQSVWSSLGMSPGAPNTAAPNNAPSALPAEVASPFRAAKATTVSPNSTAAATAAAVSAAARRDVTVGSKTNGPATVSQASPDVQNAFNQTTIAYQKAVPGASYDSAVTRTALVGVMGLQTSLKDFAKDMQGNIDKQNVMRTDGSELAQMVDSWPAGTDTQSVTYHKVAADGSISSVTENLTKEQTRDAGDSAKNAVATMSDATQMQMLQLQSLQQNYQQGVTTISNVMRTSYDMVKNTIGNIHY